MLEDYTPFIPVVPTLETDRLVLRGHGIEDFRDCVAMWGNPEVTRSIPREPLSEEEVWNRFLRYIGHWHLQGYGYWAVRDKASGRFVGDIGMADFKRESVPGIEGLPEAGWVMAPWAQGKGFATEAARAVLKWFERHFGATRTVCLVNPKNAASKRVAEKVGYKEWQRADYKGHPTIVLQRARGGFAA